MSPMNIGIDNYRFKEKALPFVMRHKIGNFIVLDTIGMKIHGFRVVMKDNLHTRKINRFSLTKNIDQPSQKVYHDNPLHHITTRQVRRGNIRQR